MKFEYYSGVYDLTMKRTYADLLNELKEQVLFCEEAGFEIAWVDEHHFNMGFVNMPNPLMTGAMLAAHTSRIRIGAVDIPSVWHPLRLAEDIALLDHLSRGRVEVAFGRGISPFDVANVNPQLQSLWPDEKLRMVKSAQTASREHYAEVLEILKKAWTQEFFSHEGTYYTFPEPGYPWRSSSPPSDATAVEDGKIVKMSVGPKPYQTPYPPMRMLMSSEPSFTEAAELGMKGWIWIEPPHWLRKRLQQYSDIRTEREGRQFRLGEQVGALRMVYVAPTYEEAKRDADEVFTPWYQGASRSRPLSYWSEEGEEVTEHTERDWEFFRKHLMFLAGSPEQVVEQIHELKEICGLDFISLSLDRGMSHKKIMSSLDLFASKVAPVFADGE